MVDKVVLEAEPVRGRPEGIYGMPCISVQVIFRVAQSPRIALLTRAVGLTVQDLHV